ncbi:MAG: PQQ-binding-like beta-propeller repeat protein [Planctomycetaceae bacterium]|nr:PQQ-binding-like beta-propeller repeat protein [Planctomycetaceae bacterium]
MRIAMCWSLVAVCCLGDSVAAQSTQVRSGIPTNASLNQFGLEVAWSAQAVLNPSRDKVAHVTLDEQLVYVQGTNGVVTAFDTETGQRVWALRLGQFDEPSFPAVSNEDIVLVVVGPSLYGVDKLTGGLMWQVRLPGAPSTGPSTDENQVYVGTLDGSVYAYSLKIIRKLYLEQRLPAWSHQALMWRYQAGKEVTSPPISVGRTVNFASRDGSLYAVTTNRRELQYQFETDAPIVAPMARVGDTQFFASENFNFYAINANNGTVLWELVTGLPIRKAPVAITKYLIVVPERGGLYCLDVATGKQFWWNPRLTGFIALLGDRAICRDGDLALTVVNADSGQLQGRIPARHYDHPVVNDRSDRIFLATSRGEVLAIREIGRELPTYHRYPERRPILPEIAPEEPAPPMPDAAVQ